MKGAVTLLENITIRIWKADVALLCHVYQEGKKKAITQERQDGYALKQKLSCPPKGLYFPFPHLTIRRLPCL